jgi:hypothetical protein
MKRILHRSRRRIALICLLLAWLGVAVSAPGKKSAGNGSEFKLIVPPDRAAAAAASLGLAKKTPAPLDVLFFDTSDAALQAKNLILRVRHKGGTPGASTVKLRMISGQDALSDVEQSIPPENEWTNPDVPLVSRSLTYTIPPDQYASVLREGASPETLFNGKQRRLVEARLPAFQWGSLVAHGPVRGEIWDRQCKLKGFPLPVSVERWRLQEGDKSSEILEVSAKVTGGSEPEAKEMAAVFFRAAEDAGFGPPNSLTKTQLLLDYFQSLARATK